MSRRAAAAIVCLIGCSGSRSSDADNEVVLRVSVTAGLSDFAPRPLVSGSSAAAMDLVFDMPDPHIESMRGEGAKVILVRRDSSPFSAEDLAKALRYDRLVSARAIDAKHIEAHFADEKTAALAVQYQNFGFDVGPFEIEDQEPGVIRLMRRGESNIEKIELVESTRSDEWRRLLAHELDVVPLAASIYRGEFAGLSTVRILDIPANDTVALYFNVRTGPLSDVAVRQRISSAIHREAIALVACGDRACAAPRVEIRSTAELPARASLLVPEDFTTMLTTAKILRHQLEEIGVEIDIVSAAVPTMVERMNAGQFEMALLPLTLADHRFGFFLSPGHPKGFGMTGFANPDYDAAVDRGDLPSAQAILDRELPVTKLFELRTFAAVDASFCGEVTPSSGSFLWLKGLSRCAP